CFRTALLLLRRCRARRGRRRRRTLRLPFVHHIAERDRRPAFVLLVILVLHHHPDGHIGAVLEVQRVIGSRVGREPVLPIDLLAVRLELRERLVIALLQETDALAIGLHYLEIAVVHPNLALEVALALLHFLGLHREGKASNFVHLLLPQVLDIVLRDFG